MNEEPNLRSLLDRPRRAGAAVRLRLDSNEGPPPRAELLQALASTDPQTLRRYPEEGALEERLAEALSVEREQVLLTAGAEDGIVRFGRAFLSPGQPVILFAPTFGLFRAVALQSGAEPIELPWWGGDFPMDAYRKLRESLRPKRPVTVLVTPNNPTGGAMSAEQVDCVRREARGLPVLLDLAYDEYSDEPLLRRFASAGDMLVLGTFAKAYGLAGLRVGYAVGPLASVRRLAEVAGPYAVSGLSRRLAELALRLGPCSDHLGAVARERRELVQWCAERGIPALASQGNFVLFCAGDKAPRFWECLAREGVAIRQFPGRAELDGWLRCSLPGNRADFEFLLGALERTRVEVLT